MDMTASALKREEALHDVIAEDLARLRQERDDLRQQVKDKHKEIKALVAEQVTNKQVLTVLYRRQKRMT